MGEDESKVETVASLLLGDLGTQIGVTLRYGGEFEERIYF